MHASPDPRATYPLARVVTSVLAGWTLALVCAVTVTGWLDGAGPQLAFGLGRRSIAFPAPDLPTPPLSQLAPVPSGDAPFVVRLDRGSGGSASGTLVRWNGGTYVVTASHVVNFLPVVSWASVNLGPRPFYWLAPPGDRVTLPEGRVSYWWDLAVYPVAGLEAAAVDVAGDVPMPGSAVTFVGYPSGQMQPWAASGTVLATTPHPDAGAAAVVAAIRPLVGQSGGALRDGGGGLLGIGVAATPFGVLAVGNGAILETLRGMERLPRTSPPIWARLLVWLTTAGVAAVTARAFDRVLRGWQ